MSHLSFRLLLSAPRLCASAVQIDQRQMPPKPQQLAAEAKNRKQNGSISEARTPLFLEGTPLWRFHCKKKWRANPNPLPLPPDPCTNMVNNPLRVLTCATTFARRRSLCAPFLWFTDRAE